jgi:hypothetical protein
MMTPRALFRHPGPTPRLDPSRAGPGPGPGPLPNLLAHTGSHGGTLQCRPGPLAAASHGGRRVQPPGAGLPESDRREKNEKFNLVQVESRATVLQFHVKFATASR